MGKTRDPFKKIRDTKGTFQAKMGRIKDRNGMDLTEALNDNNTLRNQSNVSSDQEENRNTNPQVGPLLRFC